MSTKSIKSSPPPSPIIPTVTRGGWIVKRLRACQALTLSLVADKDGQIVGHVAFSPVQIDGESSDWHGLGPVAVGLNGSDRGFGRSGFGRGSSRSENSAQMARRLR